MLPAVRHFDFERVALQTDDPHADPVRVLQIAEIEVAFPRRDLAGVVEDRHVEEARGGPPQLGVHDQAMAIAEAEVRKSPQGLAPAERRQHEVRNGLRIVDVRDGGEATQGNDPVGPHQRNQLRHLRLERAEGVPIVVPLAEVIELDPVQTAAPRVAELPPPIDDRPGGAVDVLELVELEARAVGW